MQQSNRMQVGVCGFLGWVFFFGGGDFFFGWFFLFCFTRIDLKSTGKKYSLHLVLVESSENMH